MKGGKEEKVGGRKKKQLEGGRTQVVNRDATVSQTASESDS